MNEPTADTVSGKVRGIRNDGLSVFRGIPYAAPPVGDRRWMPPRSPKPWFGVREAIRFGAHAPQLRSPLVRLEPNEGRMGASEDCLTVNVFTPRADGARRPVMVWIHGGGFTIGSSSQALYDGSSLARRGDVVVVTLNYRLGPLGFLRLVDLTGGLIPSTGNEGLLDQLAALKWVRENIGDFGGDADNVTVFGESAGAMSLAVLLAAPDAGGLFHRAILQSGSAQTAHTIDEANRVAGLLLAKAGLEPDPRVLLATDAELIAHAVGELSPREMRAEGVGWMPLRPVIDGELLRALPLEEIRHGSAKGLPVMAGTTADEWRFLAVPNRSIMTMSDHDLQRRLDRVLPDGQASRAVDLYKQRVSENRRSPTPADVYCAVLTDLAFRVPCERMLDAVADHGVPAYRYLFTWPSPAVGGQLGSCHALDLGFTFGTNAVDGGEQFFGAGLEADAISDQMQEAWLAYAKGDDPTAVGRPRWQIYESRTRATMEIGTNPGMRDDPWRDVRDLWSEVPDEVLRRF